MIRKRAIASCYKPLYPTGDQWLSYRGSNVDKTSFPPPSAHLSAGHGFRIVDSVPILTNCYLIHQRQFFLLPMYSGQVVDQNHRTCLAAFPLDHHQPQRRQHLLLLTIESFLPRARHHEWMFERHLRRFLIKIVATFLVTVQRET